jgi:hypothetical protein
MLWDRPIFLAGSLDEVAGHIGVVGPDGIVGVHEVAGRAAVAEYAPRLIGLTLEEEKQSACCVAGPSRSGTGGRSSPPPVTLPALRRAVTLERSALPAIGAVVRHDGGPRPAVYPVSVCSDLPPNAQPGC